MYLKTVSNKHNSFDMRKLFYILAVFFVFVNSLSATMMPPQDSTYYYDFDNDGFGDPNVFVTACCGAPEFFVSNSLDCNDTFSSINPLADEICDGFDNDCDGYLDTLIDSGPTWFLDSDADGFGALGSDSQFCTQPIGYVSNTVDCDDNNANINPNTTEICNLIDDDCSGWIDDNEGPFILHVDHDGDGYGHPTNVVLFCFPEPQQGFSSNGLDCNDNNADINPATVWYSDQDNDGYGVTNLSIQSCTAPSQHSMQCNDCNDANPNINPAAYEIVANTIDDDCNAIIDDVCTNISNFKIINYSPTAVILLWDKMNDATAFQVQYRVVGVNAWAPLVGTTVNYVKINNLLPNNNYQFRVRTKCGGQAFITSFTTPAIANTQTPNASCGTPTMSGAYVLSQYTARVFWNYVPNATKYRIQIRPEGGVYQFKNPKLNAQGQAIPAYNIATLSPNTTYQYRVQSRCGTGAWSTLSTMGSFKTLPEKCTVTPNAIVIETPENSTELDLVGNNMLLSPNPAQDKLNIGISPEATLLEVKIFNLMGAQLIQAGTNTQINISELPQGLYFVRVQTNLGETTQQFVKM